MSNPSLGLTEKQLSYLAYFQKADATDVYMPRSEMYSSQRQHLTECAKLIEQLDQNWNALSSQSDRFLTNFPQFGEEKLRGIASNVDHWCAVKRSLDKEIAGARSVYVPDAFTQAQASQQSREKQAEQYQLSVKQYLELCSIEREIVAAYGAPRRNYMTIEAILERYDKLPREIRQYTKDEPFRMLEELKGKLEILSRFNKSMEALSVKFASFSSPVRNGDLVFTYHALNEIRRTLGFVKEWVGNFGQLSAWVNTLNEENKALVIGDDNVARTNTKGEYHTYSTASSKMQALLDESKHFYRAAEVCELIEQLSRQTIRKKQDVEKANSRYHALDPDARKYVDAKILATLNSMLESSDILSQIEANVLSLESEYNKLANDIKNGAPVYAYEKYQSISTNIQKASAWLENYSFTAKWLKESQNKTTLTPNLQQKINQFATNAVKVKAAVASFDNMEAAHTFESQLVAKQTAIREDQSLAQTIKADYEKLPKNVKLYISNKWVTLLNDLSVFHEALGVLWDRVRNLERQYDHLTVQMVSPNYENFNNVKRVKDGLERAETLFKTLSNDVTEFQNKYHYELSLAKLHKYVSDAKSYGERVDRLSGCYDLYDWALQYEAHPSQFFFEIRLLSDMLQKYTSGKARYKEFDSQGRMNEIFERVARDLEISKRNQKRQIAAQARKEKTKRVLFSIFTVLSVAAMVVLAIFNNTFEENNWYWRWLLLCFGVGIVSVLMVRKLFDSNKPWILLGLLYSVYLVAYSIPFHFRETGSPYWFMAWPVMVVIFLAAISIMADERMSAICSFVYMGCTVVYALILVIAKIVTYFKASNFFDGGFFGSIANFFMGLWDLLSGLVVGLVQVILLVIGGGFWAPGLYPGAINGGILNIILYCLLGGFIVSAIIAGVRDGYDSF